MRHWYTDESLSGEHYSASINGNETKVLLQVGDRHGQQARAQLTASDARHCAALLLEAATLLEAADAKRKPIEVAPLPDVRYETGSEAYAEPM